MRAAELLLSNRPRISAKNVSTSVKFTVKEATGPTAKQQNRRPTAGPTRDLNKGYDAVKFRKGAETTFSSRMHIRNVMVLLGTEG
jgi:hypothetical protein